jgi:ketosteroid isomerase-like protein
MPSQARLFQMPEEVIDAWRESLHRNDLDGSIDLWMDEDSITCILPNGKRLNGHAELREGLKKILEGHFLWLDPIQVIGHTGIGISFFDSTEAVRLEADQIEPEFFLNFTYILVQGPMGWRIAHIHTSPAQEEHIQLPSTIHGFH